MGSKNTYYIKSFIWSVIAKVIDAAMRFISIPLILNYFGNDSFGVLTLAIATNAYMALLDLGIGTGAVKFFAQWKAEGKTDLIDKVGRTSISFYAIIGTVNALILLVIAFFGESWFQLTHDQFLIFRQLLILSAIFSIVNWITSVFSQLLIADEKIGFVQQISLLKAGLYLAVILLTVYLYPHYQPRLAD